MASKDQSGKDADKKSMKSRPPERNQGRKGLSGQIEPAGAFQRVTEAIQLRPQDILFLQKSVGNRAILQVLAQRRQARSADSSMQGTYGKADTLQLQSDEAPSESGEASTDSEDSDHDIKEKKLNDNGITIRSSGNCSDKTKSNCTSLDGMRDESIDGLIEFKKKVGVDLVVTGGTEVGHAAGTYSHANGYKIDISLNAEVSKYIKDNFTKQDKKRGDGATVYKDADGNKFALESNHWDITFI